MAFRLAILVIFGVSAAALVLFFTAIEPLPRQVAPTAVEVEKPAGEVSGEAASSTPEAEKPTHVLDKPAPTSQRPQVRKPIVIPTIKLPAKEEAVISPQLLSKPLPILESESLGASDLASTSDNVGTGTPQLPPLNETAIFRAVVKIECPSEDRKGKYVGSGFVLSKGIVITAAHVIKDAGSDTCTVIFSNKDRAPSHYLQGTTENREEVKRRHDEEGIDVAVIFLPALSAYPEGAAVFPAGYPFIPYPICDEPRMLQDKLLHFGYPSNYLDQSYLSKSDGEAVVYADIQGIKEQLSEDQTYSFRSPVFGYTNDQSRLHPYMVSRVPSFYGDSGGLAFNAAKQCILGPHRGGTIGGGAGENFSVFPLLGWEKIRTFIPR